MPEDSSRRVLLAYSASDGSRESSLGLVEGRSRTKRYGDMLVVRMATPIEGHQRVLVASSDAERSVRTYREQPIAVSVIAPKDGSSLPAPGAGASGEAMRSASLVVVTRAELVHAPAAVEQSSEVDEPVEPSGICRYRLIGAAVACVLLVVALVVGTKPTRVVATIVFATTLQGLFVGGRRTLAVLVGLIGAAIIGLPLGEVVGPAVGRAMGQSGLLAYGVGFVVVTLAAVVVVAVIAGIAIGIGVRRLPPRASMAIEKWDAPVGGALGLMEGLAIALLLAWGVAAVRPVAEFQADVAARPGATPNPVAERFVAATEGFDASLPGRVGKRTNPIANSSVFVVIDDFLVVMADPQARAKFESDPLFDEIGELPSVRQAFDTLRTNPEIEAAIERGVVAPQLAGDLLRSEAVLRVIRDTPVVDEVTPYVDRIAEALREARETVGEGGP